MKLPPCTLLVMSHDSRDDLWEGFFTALTAQWPELDMPIVLYTGLKSYSFPGLEIKCFGLRTDYDPPWGERIREALKQIDTEYILLMMDDFWLDGPVDDAFFCKCLRDMEENPDVAVLNFKPASGSNIRDGRFQRFERRPQRGEYRFNCQVAIWRRKRLIKFILPCESSWEWETQGSIRSGRYRDGFYTLTEGETPVFSYDHIGVIEKGKWCKETVEPLRIQYGLSIDYSRRGVREQLPASTERKLGLLERLRLPNLPERIKNRLHRELLSLLSYLPEIRKE